MNEKSVEKSVELEKGKKIQWVFNRGAYAYILLEFFIFYKLLANTSLVYIDVYNFWFKVLLISFLIPAVSLFFFDLLFPDLPDETFVPVDEHKKLVELEKDKKRRQMINRGAYVYILLAFFIIYKILFNATLGYTDVFRFWRTVFLIFLFMPMFGVLFYDDPNFGKRQREKELALAEEHEKLVKLEKDVSIIKKTLYGHD